MLIKMNTLQIRKKTVVDSNGRKKVKADWLMPEAKEDGRLYRESLKQEYPTRYSSLILTGELWTYPVALNILKSYCSIIETSHTREHKISGKSKILLV